ncbi:MAG: lmo0937 family membrane protein [Chloroflexi bacterium]|nr:lmo0937 family membrane protein [Chloroflexota bacterium]
MLHGILWTILVICLIVWAVGFFFAHLGSLIHIALVIAVICLLWSLITGAMGGRRSTY